MVRPHADDLVDAVRWSVDQRIADPDRLVPAPADVEEGDGAFRAHVSYTAGTGQKAHLYGPRRLDAWAAEQDLAAMRGVAAVFPEDRVKAFQAMHAEARRIQDRAKYAREIQEATFRRMSSAASDSEEDEHIVVFLRSRTAVVRPRLVKRCRGLFFACIALKIRHRRAQQYFKAKRRWKDMSGMLFKGRGATKRVRLRHGV